VTTLGFGVAAANYALSPTFLPWFVVTSAPRPSLFGANILASDRDIYYFCLIGFFLVLLGVRRLRESKTGRNLIATRDNEAAARATALNTTRQKLIAFLISGAIAGFAGALFVVQQQGVNNGSFTADTDIALFSMVVIGGLGSVPGVVVGAIAVWSAMYFLPAGWAQLVNGGGILLLLVVLPVGLSGVMYNLRGLLLYKVAARRGLATGPMAAQLRSNDSLEGDGSVPTEDEPMPLPAFSTASPPVGNGAPVSGSTLPTSSQASASGPINPVPPASAGGPGSPIPQ
jgi:hypothetical protein